MPDWEIREVDWPIDPPAAVQAFAAGDELAWLDSASAAPNPPAAARYSLICARPLARLEQVEDGPATLRVGGKTLDADASGWRLWQRTVRRLPVWPTPAASLSPGWIGYVGFGMARQLEHLPQSHCDELGLPPLRLALYDRGVLLDHVAGRAWAVRAADFELDGRRAEDPDWLARWNAAAKATAVPPAPLRVERHELTGRTAHEAAVARALAYIAAGDVYQVNLARCIRLEGVGDALGLYAAVRAANPAPYAALLQWPGGAVASVSPELFLRVRGDEVLTRPIKGTRPRCGEPVADAAARADLLGSAKEAAELTMIVDLHRNDLGRVCRFGSVQVARPRAVEAHPTVFHTVADVVGRLSPGRTPLDALAACFPAGSVTGVPKIRAMQIIDELEPVARGVYTGAVGGLGLDGQMTFNVAIRTLQMRGSAATLYIGGGIVADSDPAAEYEETCDKARGILRGLSGPPVANRCHNEVAPITDRCHSEVASAANQCHRLAAAEGERRA